MRRAKRDFLVFGLSILCLRTACADEQLTVDLANGTALQMVWIEPGTFVMGTTEGQAVALRSKGMYRYSPGYEYEEPAHPVTISQGFYLGRYEVTQKQWVAVMGSRPWSEYLYKREGDDFPANMMSWYSAVEFIHGLNQAAGDSLYRMPTEAEWEYACRAGTTTIWFFGDDESQLLDYANIYGGGMTREVGRGLPNPWGLYDMYGNVFEWCQDGWGPTSRYTTSGQVDPFSPNIGTSSRVVRGGDYNEDPQWARSAYRFSWEANTGIPNIGLRVLRMGPRVTGITPQNWGQVKSASNQLDRW